MNAVARGPAGGHCRLGTGSTLRGRRLGVMGVVGIVLGNVCVSAHYVTLTVFAPASVLSLFCHFILALTKALPV